MTTGVLTTTATLYYGPSTTNYLADISFPAGTRFNVLWQEGLWYYVSVQGGARRNYVLKSFMTVSGAVPTYYPSLLPRIVHTYGVTRLGPTTNYPQNGSLIPDTTVHYLNTKKEGDFALIQITDQATGKYKRVWFEHMKVGTYSGPVNHRYITGTYNGITLQIIKTHANNIRLLDQTTAGRKSLKDSGYFGCMSTKNIYLIVTLQSVTTGSFRSAIQSYLGISDGSQLNPTMQCIMLDGSLSSQLRAKDSSGSIINASQTRPLAQIVVLKDAT